MDGLDECRQVTLALSTWVTVSVMRRCLAMLGAVAIAVVGTGAAHAAPIESPPSNLTLRLVDLPPGYTLSDPTMCVRDFDGDLTSRAVIRFGRGYLRRGCATRFEQEWAPLQDFYGPVEVYGGAMLLRSAIGAKIGARLGDQLVCLIASVCGPGLRQVPSPRSIGDETVLFEGSPGERDDAVVIWRSDRVLGFVTVGGLPTDDGPELALDLAEKQQSRMSSPTPLLRGDNNDSEVPIDNPHLGFDVAWLGRSFEPPHLPRRRLAFSATSYGYPDFGGPEWEASLEYGLGDVSLRIWPAGAWQRHRRSKQARLFLCAWCGTRRSIQMDNRRLTLFAIPSVCLAGRLTRFHRGRPVPILARSNKPLTKRCAHRRPDRFVGATRLGNAVVSINLPYCFPCERPSASPYNSARGVRAIARGLLLHEPAD